MTRYTTSNNKYRSIAFLGWRIRGIPNSPSSLLAPIYTLISPSGNVLRKGRVANVTKNYQKQTKQTLSVKLVKMKTINV